MTAITKIKAVSSLLSKVMRTNSIKSKLNKARRVLKKDKSDEARDKSMAFMKKAHLAYQEEVKWRVKASKELSSNLKLYDDAISKTIGLRQQSRLTDIQAKGVASCLSTHRNISLAF